MGEIVKEEIRELLALTEYIYSDIGCNEMLNALTKMTEVIKSGKSKLIDKYKMGDNKL